MRKYFRKIYLYMTSRILLVFLAMIYAALSEEGEVSLSEPKILQVLEIDRIWSGHPVGFCLLTQGQYQFVACYDTERRMVVSSRKLDENVWNKKVLPSKLGWDSHNYVTMAIDREGCLHVSGNMHGIPLVYFRSAEPYNIQTLEPVHKMTGEAEQHVTYPRFFQDAGKNLLFTYRDGGSGNGSNLINIYDEKTMAWKRFLDVPLFDGKGLMNAYPLGPVKGPDNLFHIVWMWRDTGDCITNHDISYMTSPDLKHWTTPGGKKISLPVTLDNKDVIVDPVPPAKGLINMGFGVGLDPAKRAVIHYHKYDEKGNSQIYLARWENEQWRIRQVSSWDSRWEFGGYGSVPCEVGASPAQVLADGRLAMSWHNRKQGGGTWQLDPESLKIIGSVQLPEPYPKSLRKVESAFEGMQVRWCGDSGECDLPNVKYCLRWETLPSNRDQPRKEPLPEPSILRLYKLSAE